MSLAKDIASHLLKIQAVYLKPEEPFTWASGIQSPIYTDNRVTLAYPETRTLIENGFVEAIKKEFPEVEVIAGTATAGIPHGAIIADKMNLPFAYIRSKPKDHGAGNQIEGRVAEGQKMVVVEDLISTGGSVLDAVAAAEREGADVIGVVAIFMYVGVEVCVGNNINLYGKSLNFDPSDAALLSTIYWGLMLVGRLCGSFLSGISASKQLLITSLGAGILVLGGMILNNPYLLVGAGLFHSVMWGAIFSLAIDKLGKYTSAGSGALMMGIVGGAILPLVQGFLADSLGGWQFTWIIVVIGEAYLLYYALVGHKVRQLP